MSKSNIRLKLIIPKRKNADTEAERWENTFWNIMSGVTTYSNMAAAIPILAALTPRDVSICIEDENVEALQFDEPVDIVGITGNTSFAPRMYELAEIFKSKGVTVVLGGVHVSMFPEEGLRHADSIVVGEAEGVWRTLFSDFKKGELRQIYRSDVVPELDKQPLPSYRGVRNQSYSYYALQTTRGCSFACDFCYVHTFFGNNYRIKSVSRVVQEVKALKRIQNKRFYFCDDHFTLDVKRAKKLLKALIPLNVSFAIQARLEIYKDPELLDLLQRSGCMNIIIGFESVRQVNIDEMGKKYTVDEYAEAIQVIQSKGLLISGSFIVGFDHDDVSIFKEMHDFVGSSGLGNCCVNILTPLPGTSYYDRMKKEKRILHHDWTYYDCRHVCFQPKQMTVEELQNGFYWLNQQLFSVESVYERTMNLYQLWNKGNRGTSDRLQTLLLGLASHHVAYSYPKADAPPKE